VPFLALVALYYGAAHLGFALNFTGPVAAIVWLPVGIGIGFLYVYGLQYWPAVLAGDLLTNNYSSLPLGSAVGQSLGNLAEVVLAAFLIRRWAAGGSPLTSVSRLIRLVAAVTIGTAISATVGLLSLRAGGVVSSAALPKLWRTWWLGDLSGALIVTPLMIAWHIPPSVEWLRGRVAEATFLLLAILGLSAANLHSDRPIGYLVLPALMLGAWRFGARGATLGVAIASAYAVWATTHYEGPFGFHSITWGVLATQLYIIAAALSALALAALASERDDYASKLRASRSRLAKAAETERQRIEHNLHDGAQQRLTALAVYLGIAAEEARHTPSHGPALIERAERDLLLAIDELRALAHGLQPPVLKQQGLARAIRGVAARSTVPVTELELQPQRFDEAAEATAYFVVVESLTNVQKHSQASSARVRVGWSDGMLRVEVTDDGVGGAVESGAGLEGLRDRVEGAGGRFQLRSPTGTGTHVTAEIPATLLSGITQSG
jgi:signal transduction histidine kinase